MTSERAGVSAPPDLVFTTFIRATPEAQEGLSAFLEKRPAEFVD